MADVHELDEAQGVAPLAEERRHRDDLILVGAALDHRVHLHRQSGGARSVDAFEHAIDREIDVVQRAKLLVVERIEADGDPAQAGVRERLRLLRQQRPVRRQGQIHVELGELRDQPLQVAAHERLTARDADLPHAAVDEDARDPRDLLERQELAPLEEAVIAAVDLLRHAVDAAEVAAVGDRDAQVAQRASEGVEHVHPGTVALRG